ncbi:hypothetical protein P6N53_14050 [Desulforamulus aquiferis]|uniref:Uncharacterized protein n=2 Tax=Desulforamulus aquiferis TaxID=1397668 RepID=A0AAW7ZFU5_9FIRM|nr:hypothetical protein [Desulforamulus aquiferis]RYD06300.1 hypothetical protein N752_05250 [Desulforamulus aquiferis]
MGRINVVVETIREGNINNAYEMVNLLIDDISKLLDNEQARGEQIEEAFLNKLNALINEIKLSMFHHDVVYLVDLLKYELPQYIIIE